MSKVLNTPAFFFFFSYFSRNKDGGAHEHMAYFSERKVKILHIFLLFSTVISVCKVGWNIYV